MIQKIPYQQIDFQKYNDCIVNSQYPVIYAESWYLDIVTRQDWDVFVLGDYDAVMPIPYGRLKKSFWKKSVVQPYFAQQLGVFYQEESLKSKVQEFYSELMKLSPVAYHFNYSNSIDLQQITNLKERNNFVLDLNKSYEEIYREFSTTKKQSIKKAHENELFLEKTEKPKEVFEFLNHNMPLKESQSVKSMKWDLLLELINQKRGVIYKVINKTNQLISVAVFLISQNRIYYMHSASNNLGRELLATDLVLNHIIKENANSDFKLDFEGSNIEGIAKFMSRFGAQNQPFYQKSL